MTNMFSACFDELTKISVRLTEGEKRRQAIQFAGLGATTIPAMSSLQSKVMTGKWVPKGVHPGKFLLGTGLAGLFWGGALPAAQHMIARSNIHKSQRRLKAQKELQTLAAPERPATAVKQLPITTELPNAS